jgi:hypothetical protein
MAARKAILALDFDEVFILQPGTPTAKGAYPDRARTPVTVKLDSGLVGTGDVWYSPRMIEALNVIVSDADKILLASSWGKASMKAVKVVGLHLPRRKTVNLFPHLTPGTISQERKLRLAHDLILDHLTDTDTRIAWVDDQHPRGYGQVDGIHTIGTDPITGLTRADLAHIRDVLFY